MWNQMMISDLLCVNRDSLVDVHVHVLCYEKVSLVSLGLFFKIIDFWSTQKSWVIIIYYFKAIGWG